MVLLTGMASCFKDGFTLARRRARRKKACREDQVTVAHDGNVKAAVPESVRCGRKSGQGARNKARGRRSEKRTAIDCRHLQTKTMTEADRLLRQSCAARHWR
jgi:hypothetical protein